MKVLYHHRTRGQDVEAVHIRGIVGGLRGFGHKVAIVSPPFVDVENSHRPAPDAARSRPSPWSFLSRNAPEALFEGVEMAYNAYALPALESRLLFGRYELLYERYALFNIAGVVAARRHGIPMILEVNDAATVNRIRPLKLQAAARRVERFVWAHADAVVTITHYFRDLIVEGGVPEDRVFVIPNAVDDIAFATGDDSVRGALGLSDKISIGYVGAMNHWRRLDLLIEAFAKLATKHSRAHLLLIGEGPDREAITRRVAEFGLAARVTFTGKVSHAQIPAHLSALDIAVIPHSNTYGSPMKLFEYMAAGRAVVAPWLPPIVSVIGQNDGGILFAPLDGAGLERALDLLLSDSDRRIALGQRAREKVMAEYVWKRHAQTVLDIHSSILSRGDAR